VRGSRVVLVDDVMTTGATLKACTQALLSGGVLRVDVVVLARTPA
jgi:predicted amidophosphoribosyltransferase